MRFVQVVEAEGDQAGRERALRGLAVRGRVRDVRVKVVVRGGREFAEVMREESASTRVAFTSVPWARDGETLREGWSGEVEALVRGCGEVVVVRSGELRNVIPEDL